MAPCSLCPYMMTRVISLVSLFVRTLILLCQVPTLITSFIRNYLSISGIYQWIFHHMKLGGGVEHQPIASVLHKFLLYTVVLRLPVILLQIFPLSSQFSEYLKSTDNLSISFVTLLHLIPDHHRLPLRTLKYTLTDFQLSGFIFSNASIRQTLHRQPSLDFLSPPLKDYVFA